MFARIARRCTGAAQHLAHAAMVIVRIRYDRRSLRAITSPGKRVIGVHVIGVQSWVF
jgi:hypothetical protein